MTNLCDMAEMEVALQQLLISSPTIQLLASIGTTEWHDTAATEKLALNGCNKIGSPESVDAGMCKTFVTDLSEENYEKVVREFFHENLPNDGLYDSAVVDTILANSPIERHWEVIIVGISALQLFVEINWTGRDSKDVLNAVGKSQTAWNVCASEWLVDAVNG